MQKASHFSNPQQGSPLPFHRHISYNPPNFSSNDCFLPKKPNKLIINQDINPKNEENDNPGNNLIDFKILEELGKGSYGIVYKVRSLVNKKEYVIKKIDLKILNAKHRKESLQEVQLLKRLSHQNMIKYYNSFLEKDILFIVMEYAEGGDLQQLIKSKKDKKELFTEKEIWTFAHELLQAIDHLHSNSIIHRDIKTLNVFLSKNQEIKLGDLGVSKIVSQAGVFEGTRVGTPLYLSPELVQSKPYDYRIDVWALGCVLYHLTNLEPPFLGENLISLGYNIVNKSPKPLNSIYSIKLANFIMRLLEKNPGKRPKINELLIEFDPMNRRNIKEDKLEKKGKIEITNEKEYLILKRNILEEKSTKYRKFHEKYKKINKIPLEEPLSEIKDENIKKNSNNEKKIENFQNKQVFNNNFINSPEILKNKEKNTEKKQIQDPPLRQNFIQDTFLAQNLIQDLSLAQKPMQDPPSFVKDSGQEVSLAKDQIQYKSDPNFRKNMKPHVIFELKNAKNINNFGFFSKNIQNSRIRPMSANFKPKFKTAESFYPLIKQIKQQNLAEMPQNIESNYEKDKKIEETEKKEFDSKSSRPKSAMLPFSRQFRENIVNIPKLIEEVGDNFSNIEKESEEIKKYQENLNLLGLKRPKTAIFRGETKEKRKLTIYDLF